MGPHRGGRTVGATGNAAEPNVFYIGVNNGGVWKTTDYGRVWKPVFDQMPTGSIGDVAVAPSNPRVVYAASGEGLQRPDLSVGDGVYKSTDAGKTWVNTGLKEVQQIGGIAIDPRNDQKVFIAALGHPYGANKERGIYRTKNGGKTWQQVLYIDENTGAIQVTIDPQAPETVYADMWAGRLAPWENGLWQGAESGLFKSTDGGDTWTRLRNGLPSAGDGLGRIGFSIAHSRPQRMYACVDATTGGGFYTSDDGGKSWAMQSPDKRLWDRGSDFAECHVDPKNPNTVYVANVVTWKSTDAGKTWVAFRGAPGGDDYHRLWINPENSNIILLASDQGAIITVNGGETWSSWYNQPTAQFYHVNTDNAFPYNIYGGQQESGSVGIASRGNDGQVTFREWHPVGVEEYGYIAPDPLDNNIIYGGKITRFNKATGQVQNIAPEAIRSGRYRFLRTAPVIFSPVDKKTLYFAGNVLFKTVNGGKSWNTISPDLSRQSWDIPSCVGVYADEKVRTMARRGVIYTIAPSHKNINTIWTGTDDGQLHITRNGGKTWSNITPDEVTSWSKVSLIDAGHFDNNTAYAAINKIRLDDLTPYILRTHNGGQSWQQINNGLPNAPVNVVREDPQVKGLLFAGTETAVYVSFNDGDNWQPLRLNMPATSIRDLVIKDNDIVVATHGRSFWVLDGINALRGIARENGISKTTLVKPGDAYRVRWNMNTDTPLPQEEPAGQNPPDGAIIDYYLDATATETVTLDLLDNKGRKIRTFSSEDKPYTISDVNIPLYWVRPQQILSGKQGAHRFLWDMHYTPLATTPAYPIGATYGATAPNPSSPWVMPGNYTVRLTVNGKTYTQPLQIKQDPRVKTPVNELIKIHDLSYRCYERSLTIKTILDFEPSLSKESAFNEIFDANVLYSTLIDVKKTRRENLERLKGTFMSLMGQLHESEMPVTMQLEKAVEEADAAFTQLTKFSHVK